MDAKYIVLVGNVVEGIRPFGPFPNYDAAFQWALEAEFALQGVAFHITVLWWAS